MTESTKKPIGVIILNWNGAHLLRRFLPSIIKFTPERIADIIVADNGSDDDSIEVVKSEFPEVTILPLEKNYGFAGGYNRAIQATNYEYTVLLNSDVEVRNNWLTPLYQFIKEKPQVAALQPNIMSLQNPEYFEYAGAAGGYLDKNGYPYCRGRIFDCVEKDAGQYSDPKHVMWASGAALMVRTADYLQAGGLDEAFFAHMEEIDLCWRLWLLGKQVWAVPGSEVFHLGGASLDATNPRKTYLNFRNSLLMLSKNLPDNVQKRRLIFRRKILDGVAAVKFLVSGKLAHVKAIARAHKDFAKMRKELTTLFTPEKNMLDCFEEGRRNILIDYYIRRKDKFSKL